MRGTLAISHMVSQHHALRAICLRRGMVATIFRPSAPSSILVARPSSQYYHGTQQRALAASLTSGVIFSLAPMIFTKTAQRASRHIESSSTISIGLISCFLVSHLLYHTPSSAVPFHRYQTSTLKHRNSLPTMTTMQQPRFHFLSLQHFSICKVIQDFDSVRRGTPMVFILLVCAWMSLLFTFTVYSMQLLLLVWKLVAAVFRTVCGSEMLGTVITGAWVQAYVRFYFYKVEKGGLNARLIVRSRLTRSVVRK